MRMTLGCGSIGHVRSTHSGLLCAEDRGVPGLRACVWTLMRMCGRGRPAVWVCGNRRAAAPVSVLVLARSALGW